MSTFGSSSGGSSELKRLLNTGPSPNFAKRRDDKTRRLLQGRHPSSFPRDSEFWHYYHLSEARLDRIHKGRKVCDLVPPPDMSTFPSSSQNSTVDDIEEQRQGLLSLRSSTLFSTGSQVQQWGLDIDMRSRKKLHYGMSVALLSSGGDEVLCVTGGSETASDAGDQRRVVCIPLAELSRRDRYVFKLMDLHESNSGTIATDGAIWLQLVDEAGEPMAEVLGSKVLHAPRMSSIQAKDYDGGGESEEEGEGEEGNASLALSLDETEPTAKRGAATQPQLARRRHKRGARTDLICGGIAPFPLSHTRPDMTADERATATKYKSKLAKNLAQWRIRGTAAGRRRELDTLDQVYLEQDLYCIATERARSDRWMPKSSTRPNIGDVERLFACLRPATLQRGEATTLDRRCMWRFCDVRSGDNDSSHLLINAAKGSDQKVFSAAVESLENSCALREGRRTRLVEGAAGLHELAGGQRFATALRHAAAADTFVAESRQMRAVAAREGRGVGEHFETLSLTMDAWDWRATTVRNLSAPYSTSAPFSPLTRSLPSLMLSVDEDLGRSSVTTTFLRQTLEDELPRTTSEVASSGEDVASIRRDMERIARKNMLGLTEELDSLDGLQGIPIAGGHDSTRNGRHRRHWELLRRGEEFVHQAILHEEKEASGTTRTKPLMNA